MSPRNRIADSVRRYRQDQRLTQVELARKAGIPRASLALMESPTGNPSMASVLLVAEALAVPLSELLVANSETSVALLHRDQMDTWHSENGLFVRTQLTPTGQGRVKLFSVLLRPGCDEAGRIHAKGCLEYFFCQTGGDAVLRLQAGVTTVHSGETAWYAAHQPRSYGNPGKYDISGLLLVVDAT